ncbi:Ig-like domain-containing protein [Rhodopseudomonas sp. NSM]|uniref:Ig-like domain-containing protein n=1 Tax=Rhodopseudomonas sp. NSM TaxID=3457630 RepID=UPI004036530C
MSGIPLSWNDPIFSGVANSGSVVIKNGGTLSNKSITDTGNTASVVGTGSFTLDNVRISSAEGVRVGGSGNIVINNSYIESTGKAGDHADSIQAYAPGSNGNLTITNTAIVAHENNATAGMFIADNYGGSVTLNNVMFDGGPFGLRIAADNQDITLALKDVYFVGPFEYNALLLQEVNADIHIVQWENVRYATIVDGQLVPGAPIAAPFAVEGPSTPPDDIGLDTPEIGLWSPDSGKVGDGVTNANKVTLQGTASANTTIKIFDGGKQIGTVGADAGGNWKFTSAALTDGAHKFTVTSSTSTETSAASAARTVVVDTAAPVAPTLVVSTSAAALAASQVAVLTGTAEANSTIKVFDGSAQIGTASVNGSGVWTFTTATLATGNHSFAARAMDAAGNTGAASAAVAVTVTAPAPTPQPSAPTIASVSNDSGVKGDGITNDNTLTLTGTAAAGGTVKIYDGSSQIGTTKAGSDGSWSYTTSALTDAKHTLTATVTSSSGQVSAASAAVAMTVDTKAPGAPTIGTASAAQSTSTLKAVSVDTGTMVNLSGTAEARSTVDIYDGNTKIGSVAAGSTGAWNFSTDQLSSGQHTLTARATDVAGNVGTTSTALQVNVTGSSSAPPPAPKIVSFSNDTGKAGDGITKDKTLKLDGTAAADSKVTVFDGNKAIGSTVSDSSGAWSFTTAALSDGAHNLTAKVTDSKGQTGAASSVTAVTVDTSAPNAPTLGVFSSDGKALSGSTTVDDFLLKGTAEANSLVKIYDAGKQIGSATAKGDGTWSYQTGDLSNGDHKFAAIASDSAGNASAASSAKSISVIDPPSATSGVDLTDAFQGWNNSLVIKGTADAYSQIKIFDGSKTIGTVKANADGDWWFGTGAVSSSTVHTFTAKGLDSSGQVASSSGSTIVGTYGANTLKGTSADDILIGNGHRDTFVFAPDFGNDTIKDFCASGPSHDVVQFSKSVFDSFADILSHATQSGQDVVIAAGNDSLTLKNTKIGALDKSDFQFV